MTVHSLGMNTAMLLAAVCFSCGGPNATGQENSAEDLIGEATRAMVYKTTPQGELKLYLYEPVGHDQDQARPAMVFFHGGGWNGGTPKHFDRQSAHLAGRGMVAISVQYRLKNDHATTPIEAAQDAVSAMRFVRAHAEAWGLDSARIGAGGGSAGGQLAAVTATLPDDAVTPDNEVEPAAGFRPDALVLFNPVYDNGPPPGSYGHARFDDAWETYSPAHNLHADMPPTLVMLGDRDKLIPVATAEKFRDTMVGLGVRSELVIYPDQPHGFFNNAETGMFQATVAEMDKFLVSLGWLEPMPD